MLYEFLHYGTYESIALVLLLSDTDVISGVTFSVLFVFSDIASPNCRGSADIRAACGYLPYSSKPLSSVNL